MTVKKNTFIILLITAAVSALIFQTSATQQDYITEWDSTSQITCENGMCVENITFPAFHIKMESGQPLKNPF